MALPRCVCGKLGLAGRRAGVVLAGVFMHLFGCGRFAVRSVHARGAPGHTAARTPNSMRSVLLPEPCEL